MLLCIVAGTAEEFIYRGVMTELAQRLIGIAIITVVTLLSLNFVLTSYYGYMSDDAFVTVLAEALISSGLAMAVCGSSRPASGGCHEIMHAIDSLFPGTGSHGELAGLGALFCTFLRGDERRFAQMSACLARHQLPRTPEDVGVTHEQFTEAVLFAPRTRPDRYTILEHLAMTHEEISRKLAEYAEAVEER